MDTKIQHLTGVLQQLADVKDGEPPKFVLHMPTQLTGTAEEDGSTVTSQDVTLQDADAFEGDLFPLADGKTPVTLDVPVTAHSYPGFDFSPPSQELRAEVRQPQVEQLVGHSVLPTVD